MSIKKYQIAAIEKIINSENLGIKKIYPMVKVITVNYIAGKFLLKIYLNDPEITEQNMYKKGFDPHYLVDRHFYGYFPYLDIPKNIITGFKVYSTERELINAWPG